MPLDFAPDAPATAAPVLDFQPDNSGLDFKPDAQALDFQPDSAPEPTVTIPDESAEDAAFKASHPINEHLVPTAPFELTGLTEPRLNIPSITPGDYPLPGFAKHLLASKLPTLNAIPAATYNVAKGVPEFMTSDAGAASIAAGETPVLGRIVAGGFAADMIKQSKEMAIQAGLNWDTMNTQEKAQFMIQLAANGVFASTLATKAAETKPAQANLSNLKTPEAFKLTPDELKALQDTLNKNTVPTVKESKTVQPEQPNETPNATPTSPSPVPPTEAVRPAATPAVAPNPVPEAANATETAPAAGTSPTRQANETNVPAGEGAVAEVEKPPSVDEAIANGIDRRQYSRLLEDAFRNGSITDAEFLNESEKTYQNNADKWPNVKVGQEVMVRGSWNGPAKVTGIKYGEIEVEHPDGSKSRQTNNSIEDLAAWNKRHPDHQFIFKPHQLDFAPQSGDIHPNEGNATETAKAEVPETPANVGRGDESRGVSEASAQVAPEREVEEPLGVNRPAVRNRSLEDLSDKDFDKEYTGAASNLDRLENAMDAGESVDRKEIAAAQDRWTAADLERFRRNIQDILPEDLFTKLRRISDLAAKDPQGDDFQKARIILEEMNRQGVTEPDLLRGMRGMTDDEAEVFRGQLEDIKKVASGVEGKTDEPLPKELQSQGPGAATAGSLGRYGPLSEAADRIASLNESKGRERLTMAEKIADATATGKTYLQAARDKMVAVGDAVKDVFKGIRTPTDLDRAVGSFDWQNQKATAAGDKFVQAIKKTVPDEIRRAAIGLWIDSGGDVQAIRDAVKRIPPSAPNHIKLAFEAAQRLTPEELQVADEIRQVFSRQLDEAQNAGVLKRWLENYYTHVWKNPKALPKQVVGALNSGKVTDYFRQSRERKLGTFIDGIEQGLEPVLDPAKIMPYYNSGLARVIASRELIRAMQDMKAPDGRPAVVIKGGATPVEGGLMVKPEVKPNLRPDIKGKPPIDTSDYRDVNNQALRGWKWVDTDSSGKNTLLQGDMAVHPDYLERVKNMMDRDRATASAPVRTALQVSSLVKGIKLGALSLFHQVHVGVHSMFHLVSPVNVPEIDWESPVTQDAVEHGLKLASEGHEAAALNDGLMSSPILHRIPGAGRYIEQYSHWLFQSYIPRLKMAVYKAALERGMGDNAIAGYGKDIKSGKLIPDELKMRVADMANNAFGELNQLWLGKAGRNPEFQRALRLAFLAPDFGEARARFLAKAATKYGGEERLALIVGTVGLYTISRVLNTAFSDDHNPHFEDPFAVHIGGKVFSIRSVMGDVAHMFTDFNSFIQNRLNPVTTKPLLETITGRNQKGVKVNALDIAKEAAPVPISLSGLTDPDKRLWQSMASALGLSSWNDNATRDTYRKAQEWKAAQGIHEYSETIPDSKHNPYWKLRVAIENGKDSDAFDAIRELRKDRIAAKDKDPDKTIERSMRNYYTHPFTGSTAREDEFRKSLNPLEMSTYKQAQADRARNLQAFQALWNRRPAK